MPTNSSGTGAPATIVNAGASPVTVVIPPTAEPLTLVITSASAITITGQSLVRPVDVLHTP